VLVAFEKPRYWGLASHVCGDRKAITSIGHEEEVMCGIHGVGLISRLSGTRGIFSKQRRRRSKAGLKGL
jgi:hypothetical protein